MESWASLLGRLKRAYRAAGLDCADGLRPPAQDEAVDRLARRLGVRIPRSLRAVWRVHGGQRYVVPGITGLFGKHRLHSPAELARKYELHREYLDDPPGAFPPREGRTRDFHPRLLPFASWDIYDLCLDSETGAVWQYSPNYLLTGGTSRPSLRSFVRELLALLAAGRPPEPDFICVRPAVDPRWLTPDVLGLARGIAADQAPGQFPILADALEDAGCHDKRILAPCRRKRCGYPDGWWVVDLLLAQG